MTKTHVTKANWSSSELSRLHDYYQKLYGSGPRAEVRTRQAVENAKALNADGRVVLRRQMREAGFSIRTS